MCGGWLNLAKAIFKIQETLFKVDIFVYNIITLAMSYFVDKQDKKAVHVYKY